MKCVNLYIRFFLLLKISCNIARCAHTEELKVLIKSDDKKNNTDAYTLFGLLTDKKWERKNRRERKKLSLVD